MVLHSLLPTGPGVAPAWMLLTVVLSLLLRGSLLCASCVLAPSCLGSGVVESRAMGNGRLLLSALLSSLGYLLLTLSLFWSVYKTLIAS